MKTLDKKTQITNALFLLAKNREVNPAGTFDNAGRWYPEDIFYAHMSSVRSPSRAYPYAYMLHCRTKKFIRNLVSAYDFKKLETAKLFYRTGIIKKI